MEEQESRLFEDVHTIAEFSTELVRTEQREVRGPDVSALEKGTRYKPDGVVEDYERIEFR